jgi:class 3 adenylate cyclase
MTDHASPIVADDTAARMLQELDTPVALADARSLAILVENARFFQAFPSTGEVPETLASRLPFLDAEKHRERLAQGRTASVETEVRLGSRNRAYALELRQIEHAARPAWLIQARDLTKQKEAEHMLDSYARMAEKNARELTREKERVEKLLLNIMPKTVYQELRDFGTTTPHKFDSASVLMLDFVGFTEMAVARDPATTIAELNDIFMALDRIAELFGCERIKTIGDAYLAVSGVPDANPDHPQNIAKLALRARRYLERRNQAHPTAWRCRIGIHTGPLIGSLVGLQKYVYDVFGPAVNMAARLEQEAQPMQILTCHQTAEAIGQDFRFSEVGELPLKGFGHCRLMALEEERGG